MSTALGEALVERLRRHELLNDAQAAELDQLSRAGLDFGTPQVLIDELIRRRWLTP